MVRRITILVTALLVALTVYFGTIGAVFADPPLPSGCYKDRVHLLQVGHPLVFHETLLLV